MKLITHFGAIVAAAVEAAKHEPATFRHRMMSGTVLMGPAEDALQRLRDELGDAVSGAEAITQRADDEDRDMTADELAQVAEFQQTADSKRAQIDARQRLMQSANPMQNDNGAGRRSRPAPTQRDGVHPTVKDRERFGFKSMGEFASMVYQAGKPNSNMDDRLRQIATTYANEGVGADGGFLVPPEFSRAIWTKVNAVENLFSRTTQLETASNNFTIPKDETTPWDTTKGVQVYWESEAAQIAQSKPLFDTSTIKLNKLTGLVPVTEELLQDAPGLESWLRAKVPMKMAHKLNRAIIRGTGVGQPLGILASPSTISVAKVGGQAADTILYRNILDMWARMPVQLRANAVWLVNQDVETQLELMEFSPGSSTPVPVYLPVGGASTSSFATLKGRPVIPMESNSAVGDKGDIILVDLSQYFGLTKAQGIQTDVSMHFFFDQAITAFRFILRVGGQPIWGEPITPEFGSTTRSWAVTLDDRA